MDVNLVGFKKKIIIQVIDKEFYKNTKYLKLIKTPTN